MIDHVRFMRFVDDVDTLRGSLQSLSIDKKTVISVLCNAINRCRVALVNLTISCQSIHHFVDDQFIKDYVIKMYRD